MTKKPTKFELLALERLKLDRALLNNKNIHKQLNSCFVKKTA